MCALFKAAILLTINIINCTRADEDTDYLVNTTKCKIPNFPIQSNETDSIYQKKDYVRCTDKGLLTYTTVASDVLLHLNRTAIGEYVSENEEIDCCYQYVYRSGSKRDPDVGIRLSTCEPLQDTQILIYHTVRIQCSNKNTSLSIYENVHQVIRVNNSLLERAQLINGSEENFTNSTNPISVLFVVVDSVSRLNFIRTMPNTYNYLLEKNFIEMKGYNKIDDATFPNFNAFLTGFNYTQSNKNCKPHKVNGLDYCPMIWYDYRKLGYITAYAEDWTFLGTFNHLKKGFTNPPTDYYFKPYFEATDLLNITTLSDMPYCSGPESNGERVLNLAKDFSITYLGKPTFGIFWMNTFSHNDINLVGSMDDKLKEFFQNIFDHGVLNESVVIFLSDHGVRYGDILKTRTGFFEVRLPLNFISLPPWFKEKYPLEASFLQKNSELLTTPFDLHKTLQHILVLSGKNYSDAASGHPKGISLLKQIPEERGCEDAGISLQWCVCLNITSNNLTGNSS